MLKSVKITYNTNNNRLTNKVIVDGQDISHGVVSAIANITADGLPYVTINVVSESIDIEMDAEVNIND